MGGEWHDGLKIALCAAGGIFSAVLYVYSTGLFIEPLTREMGWSHVEITSGMLIVGIVAAFGNPFVGLVIDRYGSGKVAVVGVVCYAAAMAALGMTGPSVWTWLLTWFAVAIASLAISVPVWLIAVVRMFDRWRGMALAIGYCGSSVAAMTVPTATAWMIAAFGWRAAYLGIGMLALLIGGTSALVLLGSDVQRVRGGRDQIETGAVASRAMLFSSKFWRIALMSVTVTLGVIGLTVHFVSICREHGIGRETSAGLAGLIGVAGIVGRLLTGALLDRFPGHIIGMFVYTIPMLACLMLWLGAPGLWGLGAIAVATGLSLGSELDLIAYLTTRYFGLAHYGLLFGILTGLVGAAAGLGPTVASVLRDFSGNYTSFARILFFGFAAAVVLVGSLGRYQRT